MRRIVLSLLTLPLLVAACSSDSGGDGVASLTASTEGDLDTAVIAEDVDREEALLAFAECLRDQGVAVDDPEVGPDGQLRLPRPTDVQEDDRQVMQAARQACAEHLEGVTIGFAERDTTEFQDMLLEYAACMRDNGWEMADPDLSGFEPGAGQGGGGGGGIFGGLEDRNDPAFLAADEVCRDIFGDLQFGRGSGGGGGGGGEG